MATVLYVDDERAISRALSSWLTRRGHKVLVASSIAEAKSALESNTIDGAFIDLWLGAESGLELFAWVNQNYPLVADKTVFVSGDIIPDPPIQEALARYTRPLLVKPFDLSELEGIVKGWSPPRQ
jgi:DNA-binding NtrC family response regulator